MRGGLEEVLVLSDEEHRTALRLEHDLLDDAAFARSVRPVLDRMQSLSGPVLVGVGREGGTDAIAWAAAEAAAMGSALRIVHAVHPVAAPDVFGVVPACLPGALDRTEAEAVLDAALARAHHAAPRLDVTARVVQGPVTSVLHRESRAAGLLVVGAPHPARAGARRLLHTSVALRLGSSARCPVTVVPPAVPAVDRDVVVGVDGTTCSGPAVAFAFRAARRRRAGLTVLYAWTADCPADLEAVTAPLATSEAAAHAVAEAAVATCRAVYPDVAVTTVVVRRDPASALVAASAGAALVVVGSRGRRGLGVFGSVSRAVLAGAAGPVAVVPRGRRADRPY